MIRRIGLVAKWWSGLLLLGFGLLGMVGCQGEETRGPAVFSTRGDPVRGEALFNQYCSRCHGLQGRGTNQGPPLVHRIYEPNHHSDTSFFRAVRNGVRSHHWQFGDMPPIPGVRDEEIAHIVGYIRDLQRKAGIF